MEEAGHAVLACMAFEERTRAKLHGTDPPERVNSEIRRANLVGIFPNREAVIRPVGALMPEQDDARAVPAATCRWKSRPHCATIRTRPR